MITLNGHKILDYEDVETLRAADRKQKNPYKIIAQKGGQEDMLSSQADIVIGGGCRGGSKPLIESTRVVTPFGYKPIGELKTNDIIIGRDGGHQKVLYNIHKGKLPCYKLTFIDGAEVISSYDHAWNVRKTCCTSKRRIRKGTGLEEDWTVWTTEMIVNFLKNKPKNGNLVVPMCEPVHFTPNPHRAPKFDPYIIGALLGDGCFSKHLTKLGKVNFTTMDQEIVDEFICAGIDMSKWSQKAGGKANDYHIKDKALFDALDYYGLLEHLSYDKFVPNDLKYGTISTRWAVLQGLMDTDCCIDKRGHCSFTSVSKQLAEDVRFLVESLGGLATISEIDTHYTKDGKRIECSRAYHLYIKIKDSHRLFRLSRKKELSTAYNGGISEYMRRIVSYEYVGEMDCCCIRVSNADSLFLVEDFVVTHNTYSLLLEALKDVNNKNFHAMLLRGDLNALVSMMDDSDKVFDGFGYFNRSKNDLTWNFNRGGFLRFSYHDGPYDGFQKRVQGHQYAFIGVDEITHIDFAKFKYLITCNRNAYGIRNRFWGTCNPDPDSWVAEFISWWIGEDGFPIPERNGVIRYCFMDGDDVTSIVWGDSKREVYEKCRHIIDARYTPAMHEFGSPEDIFVKSVAFVEAKLTDNIQLLRSDPGYLANLAGQSEEQRSRDLDGNWKFRSAGDDIIKMQHMLDFYDNAHQTGDGVRRCSCDVALEGGDSLIMWLWIGNHLQDVFQCKLDSEATVMTVRAKLREWGVMEENFAYDVNGLGQLFKGFFKNAVPFNNQEAPDAQFKFIYGNLKSQAAYMFADDLKNGNISINPDLLDMRFSGKNYSNMRLADILMKERKAIRQDDKKRDKGFFLIQKATMKQLVGHSPDWIEAALIKKIFDIKKTTRHKSRGLARYIRRR